MKADSVHDGHIGLEWKKRAEILDMDDVVNVAKRAARKNDVHLLHARDFRQFSDGTKIRRKNQQNENIIPLLETVRVAEFRKGSRNLFYKKKLDENTPFVVSNFLKEKYRMVMPAAVETDLGINTVRLDKIKKELLPHMQPRK